MKKFVALCSAALLFSPIALHAETGTADLQSKLDKLTKEVAEMSKRLDANEKHSATDRLLFTGDFRTKADSLHYQESTWSPGVAVDFNDFGFKAMNGVFGDPGNPDSPIAQMMADNPKFAAAFMGNQISGIGGFSMRGLDYQVAPSSKDIDNNILYTTRLRLNMKAKVANNVDFGGRLSMYKNWGDSSGVKVFDSWNSFTMDGTDSGSTSGDFLRVERAYFDWKNIGGSDLFLSIGRRPSTYGPPTQYRENEMRGGTPSGHLVDFNFDGLTLGYKLENVTGMEGQIVRFCYGQGFESKLGNGELFGDTATKDTQLGGFNVDVLNDGTNFVQLTVFAAKDVVDGFKGTFAFPSQFMPLFAPTINQDASNFPNMNFVTRYQPSTVIGDMKLAGLGLAREEDNGINYFTSLGWTRLEPNGKAGMFGGMGSDMVYQAALNGSEIVMMPTRKVENDDNHDGYGIYAGAQIPAPNGKVGLEYNYGSKYWTPFTQAQDDMLGSKLATRGHVAEAYYIFDINPNMFIKVGGLYYDYIYTGSGSPVGKPVKVDDVIAGKAYSMLPVADDAWDGYASLTVKF